MFPTYDTVSPSTFIMIDTYACMHWSSHIISQYMSISVINTVTGRHIRENAVNL